MSTEMPNTGESRLALLDSILREGIQRLLKEARSKNRLTAPYGRPSFPTPLISEEEFLRSCTLDDFREDSEAPEFQYNYGFNPLIYLADFLLWAHPDSHAKRQQRRDESFALLCKRALHAQRQMKTADGLREIVLSQKSGILWGPVIGCQASHKQLQIRFCALRSGSILFDISADCAFSDIQYSGERDVSDDAAVSLLLDELPLEAGKRYHIRMCLQTAAVREELASPLPLDEENESVACAELVSYRFGGREDGNFKTTCFWTPPLQEEEQEVVDNRNNNSSQASSSLRREGSLAESEAGGGDASGVEVEDAAEDTSDKTMLLVVAGRIGGEGRGKDPFVFDRPTSIFELGSQSASILDWSTIWALTQPRYLAHESVRSEMSDEECPAKIIGCFLGDVFGSVPYTIASDGVQNRPMDVNRMSNCEEDQQLVTSENNAGEKDVNTLGENLDAEASLIREADGEEDHHNFIRNEFSAVLDSMISRLHLRGTSLKCYPANNVASSASLLFAWNDLRMGSADELRHEELAYKHYLSALKKYNVKYEADLKKARLNVRRFSAGNARTPSAPTPTGPAIPPPPELHRPGISVTFEALLKNFPLAVNSEAAVLPSQAPTKNSVAVLPTEAPTRATYHVVTLGPLVQAFVLDSREGILGRNQAKWLKSCLESSEAQWKVILCGFPLAVQVKTGNRAGTATNTDPGRAHVQMPNPEELEDRDESGRLKSSLAYVLASLQRQQEVEQRDMDSVDSDGNQPKIANDLAGGSNSSSTATMSTLLDGEDSSVMSMESSHGGDEGSAVEEKGPAHQWMEQHIESGKGCEDLLLSLDSGIVVISGGTETPFVATLDPYGSGRPYVVEVGVGVPTSLDGSCTARPSLISEMPFEIRRSENMGVNVLFGEERLLSKNAERPIESCAVVELLPRTVNSLGVQILARTKEFGTFAELDSKSISCETSVVFDGIICGGH